jgi:hypothetical protein
MVQQCVTTLRHEAGGGGGGSGRCPWDDTPDPLPALEPQSVLLTKVSGSQSGRGHVASDQKAS